MTRGRRPPKTAARGGVRARGEARKALRPRGAPPAEVLERGDIFFFYRPRVETRTVGGRSDVQRFFMVLAPDRAERPLFRLFAIGRKRLPEVRPGEAHPEERNWALNVGTTSNAEELRRALLAKQYPTATRGLRLVGGAKAVGEGRYQLLTHADHSELAYVLELPKEPGPVQEEFEIKKAASYIVAAPVRRPRTPRLLRRASVRRSAPGSGAIPNVRS